MAASTPDPFGPEHAKEYDEKFAKLSAWRDALQLTTEITLAGLPDGAQLLVVGAGTGLELEYLALRHPSWKFIAVEPSQAMFERLQDRCERHGWQDRCQLFCGYLQELPHDTTFDAATMLLVSQFVLEPDLRRALFAEVARRLKAGGRLISADLAADLSTEQGQRLLDSWSEAMAYNGASLESLAGFRANIGKHVAVLPPEKLESLIAGAGFEPPLRLLQTVLIHAWLSVRSDR